MSYPPPPPNAPPPGGRPPGPGAPHGAHVGGVPPMGGPPGPPGYPQQPYGAPPRPKPKSLTAGKLMTFIGGSLLAVCLIAGLVISIVGGVKNAGVESESFPIDGVTTVYLEKDSEWLAYVPAEAPDSNCVIIDGPASTSGPPRGKLNKTFDGRDYRPVAGITINVSGDYTFRCENPETIMAPSASTGLFGIIGGIAILVLGGVPTGVITLIGIILWVAGRKKMRTP